MQVINVFSQSPRQRLKTMNGELPKQEDILGNGDGTPKPVAGAHNSGPYCL